MDLGFRVYIGFTGVKLRFLRSCWFAGLRCRVYSRKSMVVGSGFLWAIQWVVGEVDKSESELGTAEGVIGLRVFMSHACPFWGFRRWCRTLCRPVFFAGD